MQMIEQLTPELDADIQKLTHDEAIGVIRALVSGEWVDPNVIRLGMRVQRRTTRRSRIAGKPGVYPVVLVGVASRGPVRKPIRLASSPFAPSSPFAKPRRRRPRPRKTR
jgi:hypothetical protein